MNTLGVAPCEGWSARAEEEGSKVNLSRGHEVTRSRGHEVTKDRDASETAGKLSTTWEMKATSRDLAEMTRPRWITDLR